MNFARTILAILIAASVAMLPVASGALGAKSSVMFASMDMSPADNLSDSMDMSDCCPHKAVPCENTNGDCTSMAACAGTFLGLSGPVFSVIVFPVVLAEVMPVLTSQTLRSQTSSPPFRPPRV